MNTARRFSGWRILASLWLVVLMNLAFAGYGAGVIGAFMIEDLGIDRSTLGLGFTGFALSQGFSAPFVAMLLKLLGARLTLACGSLFLAAASFALAHLATAGWHYVVGFGVGVGVGVGFSGLIPCQTCIAAWFSQRRGLALGLLLAATGIGGFIVAPLLNELIVASGGNWRVGWYFIGACALLNAANALLFVRDRPEDLGQVQDGIAAEGTNAGTRSRDTGRKIHRSDTDWSLSDALRTRSMWLIVFGSIGFGVPVAVILAHGVPHLIEIGHTPASAAMAIATLALCSVLGKLGSGFLCDRFEPRFVWSLSLIMTALGIALAADALSQPMVYAFSLFLGIGYGASIVCWSTIVANYFGTAAFPMMMGVQTPLNTVVSSASPLLVGLAYDSAGTYQQALFAVGALSLLSAFMLLLATPPKRAPATA